MDERTLRTVLLIQAVEESDTKGELLPLAEREEATQSVLGSGSDARDAFSGESLSRAGERVLARRAAHLHERLALRAPVTEELLSVAAGSGARDGLFALALVVGLLLAVLDGRGYIDILGFALLGLIAWNVLVYVLLIANRLRPRALSGAGLSRLYGRWMARRAAAVMRRSHAFNAPLAAALPRFATDWGALSQALVMQRSRCIFHLAAALVPVGMIAGLAVRGILLRDHAAWSGSFFGAAIVRIFLQLLYGPAAAVAGTALPPAAADVEALHVTSAAAGAAALPWIFLVALTLTFYIIVPRMLACAAASVRLWRIARNMAVPASVIPYARRTLRGAAAAPDVGTLEG